MMKLPIENRHSPKAVVGNMEIHITIFLKILSAVIDLHKINLNFFEVVFGRHP